MGLVILTYIVNVIAGEMPSSKATEKEAEQKLNVQSPSLSSWCRSLTLQATRFPVFVMQGLNLVPVVVVEEQAPEKRNFFLSLLH